MFLEMKGFSPSRRGGASDESRRGGASYVSRRGGPSD